MQKHSPGLLVMWPVLTLGRSSGSVVFGVEYPKDVAEATKLIAGQASMAGLQLGLTPEQAKVLALILGNATTESEARQHDEAAEVQADSG